MKKLISTFLLFFHSFLVCEPTFAAQSQVTTPSAESDLLPTGFAQDALQQRQLTALEALQRSDFLLSGPQTDEEAAESTSLLLAADELTAEATGPVLVQTLQAKDYTAITGSTSSLFITATGGITTYSNRTITYNLSLAEAGEHSLLLYTAQVTSKSAPAGYEFNFRITIDGELKGTFSSPAQKGTFAPSNPIDLGSITAGDHTLVVAWINDTNVSSTVDSNLGLDKLEFYREGTIPPPPPSSEPVLDRTIAPLSYSSVSGSFVTRSDGTLGFYSNRAVTYTVNVTEQLNYALKLETLQITTKNTPPGYAFHLDIYVDNVLKTSVDLPASKIASFSDFIDLGQLSTGNRSIRIQWTNDTNASPYDSNLGIKMIELYKLPAQDGKIDASVITAFGEIIDGHTPQHVLDGNPATYWQSAEKGWGGFADNDDQIAFKFDQTFDISEIRFSNDIQNAYYMGELDIEISNYSTDGVDGDWYVVDHVRGDFKPSNGDFLRELDLKAVQWIRVTMRYEGRGVYDTLSPGISSGGRFVLSDLSFYGSATQQMPCDGSSCQYDATGRIVKTNLVGGGYILRFYQGETRLLQMDQIHDSAGVYVRGIIYNINGTVQATITDPPGTEVIASTYSWNDPTIKKSDAYYLTADFFWQVDFYNSGNVKVERFDSGVVQKLERWDESFYTANHWFSQYWSVGPKEINGGKGRLLRLFYDDGSFTEFAEYWTGTDTPKTVRDYNVEGILLSVKSYNSQGSLIDTKTPPQLPTYAPTDLEAISPVSFPFLGATPTVMAMSGDRAYLAADNTLFVFNVSNPNNVQLLGQLQMESGTSLDIEAVGTTVYLAKLVPVLGTVIYEIDTSNPSSISSTNIWGTDEVNFNFPNPANERILNVSNGYLIANIGSGGGEANGIWHHTSDSPDQHLQEPYYSVPGYRYIHYQALFIHAYDGGVVFADLPYGEIFYDTSAVTVGYKQFFIVGQSDGIIKFYDMSVDHPLSNEYAPPSPLLRASYQASSGAPKKIVISGNVMAILGDGGQIEIVDISDPIHPKLISNLFVDSTIHDIELQGTKLFALTAKSLKFIDYVPSQNTFNEFGLVTKSIFSDGSFVDYLYWPGSAIIKTKTYRSSANVVQKTLEYYSSGNEKSLRNADGSGYDRFDENFLGPLTGRISKLINANGSYTLYENYFDELMEQSSAFNDSDEGWAANGGIVSYAASDGNPGGHLQIEDTDDDTAHVNAPAKYLGNLSQFDGGAFSYDVKVLDPTTSVASVGSGFGRISIQGGGLDATFDYGVYPPLPSVDSWTTYSVPFTAEAFNTSQAIWDAILSDVTAFDIILEPFNDPKSTVGLDNVKLTAKPLARFQKDYNSSGVLIVTREYNSSGNLIGTTYPEPPSGGGDPVLLTTLNAQNYSSASGTVYNYSGGVLGLWSNRSVIYNISIGEAGEHSLKLSTGQITSKTAPPGYSYNFNFKIDGATVATANLNSTKTFTQSDFIDLGALTQGNHTLTLEWTNDYNTSPYDANAGFKQIELYKVPPAGGLLNFDSLPTGEKGQRLTVGNVTILSNPGAILNITNASSDGLGIAPSLPNKLSVASIAEPLVTEESSFELVFDKRVEGVSFWITGTFHDTTVTAYDIDGKLLETFVQTYPITPGQPLAPDGRPWDAYYDDQKRLITLNASGISAIKIQPSAYDSFSIDDLSYSPGPFIQPLWSVQLGSTGNDSARAGVDIDGSGNVYMAGWTDAPLNGEQNEGYDALIAKYDNNGILIWSRLLQGQGLDQAYAMDVDDAGNVYIAGYTEGSIDGTPNAGNIDAFVAKYNASGTLLWTRQLGSGSQDAAWDVTVDNSGNVIIAGTTGGSLGDGQINQGANDIFVIKYDNLGNKLWARQNGTSLQDSCSGVATDSLGNIYVTGSIKGTLDGLTTVDQDAYVIKYDSNGNKIWTSLIGGDSDDISNEITVDNQDNIYITGRAVNFIPAGLHKGMSPSSNGFPHVFITKLNTAGLPLWTFQYGSEGYDDSNAVTTDLGGNVYIAGFTRGALDGRPRPSGSGTQDSFVLMVSRDGDFIAVRQIHYLSATDGDAANGIAVSEDQNIFITRSRGNVDGQGSAPGNDAFLTKLDVMGSSTETISNKFTFYNEGWVPDGATMSYEDAGGNLGGFLSFEDNRDDTYSVYAPSMFEGDLSSFDGGTLSFDIKALIPTELQSSVGSGFGRITLLGGGLSAQFDYAPNPPVPSPDFWKTYSAPFTAEAWGVTQSTWETILSNVTSLSIILDLVPGDDAVGFDNFMITPDPFA